MPRINPDFERDDAALRNYLRRIDTAVLAPDDPAATRALVVFNQTRVALGASLVRFHAAFPVRVAVGALPVTVTDSDGLNVPSRLVTSILTDSPELTPGRQLWSLTLEFVADSVPAHGWRAYAARFADSPDPHGDVALWSILPRVDALVLETDCHPGELPLIGAFDATMTSPST